MAKNSNIVLIGMPGCGKSTVGVLLAKTLLLGFVDTDLLIQQEYHKTLCQLIDESGIDKFKEIESKVICSHEYNGKVVATGGSVVYSDESMRTLSENGIIIYLRVSLEEITKRIKNIQTRGIAMKKNCSLAQLYQERVPLYEKYADYVFDCDRLCVEQCVDVLTNYLKNR